MDVLQQQKISISIDRDERSMSLMMNMMVNAADLGTASLAAK